VKDARHNLAVNFLFVSNCLLLFHPVQNQWFLCVPPPPLLDLKKPIFLHTEQLGNLRNHTTTTTNNNNNNNNVETDFTITVFCCLSDTFPRYKDAINWVVAIRDEFS
jgi:hypothetical protein